MKKRILSILLLACLGLAIRWASPPSAVHHDPIDWKLIRATLPEADRLQRLSKPFVHDVVFAKDLDSGQESIAGFALISSEAAEDIVGFGGLIHTLIITDHQYRIRGIQILHHKETPSYAYGIDQNWWLKQFIGKTPDSALNSREDIDGISSATVSVNAICVSVKKSLKRLRQAHQASDHKSSAPTQAPTIIRTYRLNGQLIIIGIIFMLAIAYRLYPNPILLFATRFLSVALLGFLLKMLFSIVHIHSLLKGSLPHPQIALSVWVFLILTLISTLLWGRLYCHRICPFGIIQIALSRLFSSAQHRPSRRDPISRLKTFLLFLALGLAFISPTFPLHHLEPFAGFFTFKATSLVTLMIIVILIGSLFIHRFYCRYLCLAGTFLGLISPTGKRKTCLQFDCHLCGGCTDTSEVDQPPINRKAALLTLCLMTLTIALPLYEGWQLRLKRSNTPPSAAQIELLQRDEKARRAIEEGRLQLTPARYFRTEREVIS